MRLMGYVGCTQPFILCETSRRAGQIWIRRCGYYDPIFRLARLPGADTNASSAKDCECASDGDISSA
jgi:hypothetical protein